MNYLVDTNVLSELRRTVPDPHVDTWASHQPRASLYLSVLSLGEIRKGVEGITDTAFRQRLTQWLEIDLPQWFLGRILDVDATTADVWGRIQAAAGRTLPVMDGLLAATASRHGLALATRNPADFAGAGVALVNPWEV